MKIFLTYFKNEVLTYSLCVVVGLWAVFASVFAIQKKDKIVYLKMNNDSLEVLSDLNDQDSKYLEKIFIKRITQLHYTFDNESFSANIDDLSLLLDDSLKEELNKKAVLRKEYMLDKTIAQTAVVEHMEKRDDTYVVTLNVLSQNNTNSLRHKVTVKMDLKPSKRTLSNPFGLVITKFEEDERPI